MSALISSIVCSWSGVSANGNASSSSRCHGRVGAERVALRRHARRVELDELDRDVAHRLARAALGLRPVAAAHLRQRRRLAADVLREQVELIGGHEELVARVAALGRRVLEHEVLAHALDRVAAAAGDLALGELDEPADAVRRVHDVVAGLQLQRVDDVAASRCELLDDALVAADRAAVELGLGEHRELRVRRPRSRARARDSTTWATPGSGATEHLVDLARRDPALGEHIARALDEAGSGCRDHDAPAVGEQLADVRGRAVDVALERRHGDARARGSRAAASSAASMSRRPSAAASASPSRTR